MTDQSEGLAGTVRRRLDEGAAQDTVVDELVARGLSRPTAERFVERALDEMANAAVQAHSDAPASAGGTTGRVWLGIGVAVLFLVGAGAGFVGYRKWQAAQEEEARRAAQARAELAAADRARADEIRAESRAKRNKDMPARASATIANLDQILAKLRSDKPLWQCEAAMQLKQFGSREHVKDLLGMYETTRFHSGRGCALSAMVGLGETTIPMQIYSQWRNSPDPEVVSSAISGYAEIGPPAADMVLPLLRLQLQSPHWDRRFVAVESLAKLGDDARPLLTEASRDDDPRVRDRAAAALKKMTN
jgi:hypothetical protein